MWVQGLSAFASATSAASTGLACSWDCTACITVERIIRTRCCTRCQVTNCLKELRHGELSPAASCMVLQRLQNRYLQGWLVALTLMRGPQQLRPRSLGHCWSLHKMSWRQAMYQPAMCSVIHPPPPPAAGLPCI